MDELTHKILICLDRTITSTRLISCLGYLFKRYEKPVCIKLDNGPELITYQLQDWLKANHVDEHYIESGSLWQNGHNESFNGVFRNGCLNRWGFYSLAEARRVVEQWRYECNGIRPHGSINMMTPHEFAGIHRQAIHKAA